MRSTQSAQQVADRWHLLSNLSDAMQGFVLSKQALLKSLTQKSAAEESEATSQGEPIPWHTGGTTRLEEPSVHLQQQRVELYQQIQDLAANKIDVASMARQIGVSRQTVSTYLPMKQPPARTRIHRKREKLLDPYKD